MDEKTNNHTYGPVPSRRLGRSLGVDLVSLKTCSYNCIYCQLGRTAHTTILRKEYVPASSIIGEIRQRLDRGIEADYITMSGSGEPTLNTGIGDIIRAVKNMTDIPVAVITNGSLLSDPSVRDSIAAADLVVPSLDAGSAEVFEYINRPDPAVDFGEMVSGLEQFSKTFSGDIWVEVFLIYPANTLEKDLKDLKTILDRISCSRIHLNTCERPPAESYAEEVPPEALERALRILGYKAEAVVPYESDAVPETGGAVSAQDIMRMLQRRPCSVEDMAASFQTSPNEVLKHLNPLVKAGKAVIEERESRRYFRAV